VLGGKLRKIYGAWFELADWRAIPMDVTNNTAQPTGVNFEYNSHPPIPSMKTTTVR